MVYVLPQVQVFQEFNDLPAAAAHPLNAHIAGPHAHLVRYNEADEREDGFLGYYDNVQETCYSWPARPAGGLVDQSYTKIRIQDALLRYFADFISEGSMITKVSGYNNRVRSASISFKSNGDSYPRDASLYDRDVQLGDIAKVRAVVGGDEFVLWTYVSGFVGDTVAAITGAAANDANNAANQSASTTVTKISGAENCLTVEAVGTAYEGRPSGYINETYTVTVIGSSVNGDLTTARLRILSASGEDDVDSVVPAAAGQLTTIGTRGLKVKFHQDSTLICSSSADADEVSPIDLITGQKWTVAVSQAFTRPVPTSGGTYTGDIDTTYIVEVVLGGIWADAPRIQVTNQHGTDISGPTEITAASSAVSVGTKGLTISFTGTGLRKGDKYTIAATASKEGPMRTLVLGNNIDSDVPAGTEVDVELFIKKDVLEVSENRTGFAPLTNWSQSATEICLSDGIIAYEESWTDNGTELPLDVYSESSKQYGRAYVEYRAWLSTLASEVTSISDVGELDNLISGAITPDNPLKQGVFDALTNSNGVAVKFTAVADPADVDSWQDVLEVLVGREDVYGLVPLTNLQAVQQLWQAHVNAQSTAEQDRWRVAWFALEGVPTKAIVTADKSTDENTVLAVLEDDPNTSGTQYTLLRVPAANGAFVANDVRAGDVVRYLYTGDGFDNFTYTEFVVDAVLSEDQLRLLTGHSVPISTPQKIEIWRNLSATDESEEIARAAGAFGDRRVRAVWPDTILSGTTEKAGYFLCASLAGLTSGVVPQQGLTNLEIAGYTSVPRTTSKFNRSQLDTMAGSGVWIVTQDPRTGSIYTRHAVTTGNYNTISDREEMFVRNTDSISYRFAEEFRPYIGVTNAVPSLLNILKTAGVALIEVLKSELYSERLGGQIVDAEITDIRLHATLADRVTMTVTGTLPSPLNVFEIHLVF